MSIRPVHDRLVVRRDSSVAPMPAGLIAPVLAEKKKASGVVLAVGAGRRLPSGALVPLDVKPGDTVHFGEYAGIDITQDGEDVVILRECECTLVEPAQ